MNARWLITATAWVAALGIDSAAWVRSRQVAEMRQAAAQIQTARAIGKQAPEPPAANAPASGMALPALTEAEKLELLRLRGEIGRLRERQRELAGVRAENTALHAHLVTATNAGGPLAGYVRRKEAQFVGQATPEATMQSLLWAVEHRDAERLLSAFIESDAQELRARIDQQNQEAFWKDFGKMPGFRLTDSEVRSATEVTLRFEIFPGEPPQTMNLRKVGADWKIDP